MFKVGHAALNIIFLSVCLSISGLTRRTSLPTARLSVYLSVCLSIYIRVDAKDEFANSAPRVHLPQGLAHPLLFQVHLYVYVHSYISTYIHMYLNT